MSDLSNQTPEQLAETAAWDSTAHEPNTIGTPETCRGCAADAALSELVQRLQAAQVALNCIAANAESWHHDEEAKQRALNVIACWARDPRSIPESVAAAHSARYVTEQP